MAHARVIEDIVGRYEDVEAAVRAVPGVAHAAVSTNGGNGRGRLKIRLVEGVDPMAVSAAVAATLREQFGLDVDPEAIRTGAASSTHAENGHADRASTGPAVHDDGDMGEDAAAEPAVAEPDASVGSATAPVATSDLRAVICDLKILTEGLETRVAVELELGGTPLLGRASVAADPRIVPRAVAQATVDAFGPIFAAQARAEVDSVDVDGDSVRVGVTFLTASGADRLLGIAHVRDDGVARTTLRATLDALNRRVALLAAGT